MCGGDGVQRKTSGERGTRRAERVRRLRRARKVVRLVRRVPHAQAARHLCPRERERERKTPFF